MKTPNVQAPEETPMMAQWRACKNQAPSTILLFRLGDFYEAFHEDASLLSKELDITLTKRQEIPMSGVPAHSCDLYIDRLVDKGYKVAIAEQVEDPKNSKGLVKREIVRIITPATVVHSSLISEKTHNFFGCLVELGAFFGLSVLDVTTGEFFTLELENIKEIKEELCRIRPKELLVSKKFSTHYALFLKELKTHFSFSLTIQEDWHFDPQSGTQFLLKHFHVHTLDGFGLKGMSAAMSACGTLLAYLKEELHLSIEHITTLRTHHCDHYMMLGSATQKHLELIEPLDPTQKGGTLLHLLDKTSTPMGGRLLKQWILRPLLSPSEILKRQDAIEELLSVHDSSGIAAPLKKIRDLPRLIMRIQTGFATPRDLVSLRFSLEEIPVLKSLLLSFHSPLISEIRDALCDISPLVQKISSALVEDPALRLGSGETFKEGFHAPLDELLLLTKNSRNWIAHYQTTLRESTQIKTLKIGYTKAFGYYIEISRGQSHKAPEDFERRQTLVNAERFVTKELKSYEQKMLSAEAEVAILEAKLFYELRTYAASFAEKIQKTAEAIGYLDCLLSLAHIAKMYAYTRPLVDASAHLSIEKGRHPVIEASLPPGTFIPNDIDFDEKKRLLLITGPNMAGKSTYLRQAALLVILAHMGSFIPAERAHIGIVDKIFSRIGASDDLSRGQSTFMVEMSETANILHHCTSRSLVILDEIGRGTSTYDGISIAWAVAEFLLTTKTPKTLFATHYLELTRLSQELSGAFNLNVAVHESPQGIVFLHKVVPGSADKSYGIHVAKLAGLPFPVVQRAQEILLKLEKKLCRNNLKNQETGRVEQLSFLAPLL